MVDRILFIPLVGLSLLYGLALWLRALLYRTGLLHRYRAVVPVVSVGNLSAGGTGKTPTTDLLVKRLQARGLKPAVVSRGYGRDVEAEVEVVSRGGEPLLPPERAGDEPFLLARRNPGLIVVVAARRAAGIEQAVHLGAEVIVLDDGFQHLAVARDLDIVLLDARAPLGNGLPLPAGMLREFPSALGRASLVIASRCPGPLENGEVGGLPLIGTTQRLAKEGWGVNGRSFTQAELSGVRVGAFCGIADPERFFATLRSEGVNLHRTLAFPDHVCYDQGARSQLISLSAGMDVLVTTEKDAVKLADLELSCPCVALPLEIELLGGDAVLERHLDELLTNREHLTMGLSGELLAILACPACKGPVTHDDDRQEILCQACRLAYPVRDGIPVMLIDEARSLDPDK